jgi:translation initiation factor IF-2
MEADQGSEIAGTRQRLEREKQLRIKSRGVKLTDISRMLAEGKTATLNLIIKGDVDGSVQALSDSLLQLGTSARSRWMSSTAASARSTSRTCCSRRRRARSSSASTCGRPPKRAPPQREGVDIKLYNIIYEAVEDVRAALEGMLTPEEKEVLLGVAEVRSSSRCRASAPSPAAMVTEGVLDRKGARPRRARRVQVYEGELGSLKRFKDDVREVREGFECGLNVAASTT